MGFKTLRTERIKKSIIALVSIVVVLTVVSIFVYIDYIRKIQTSAQPDYIAKQEENEQVQQPIEEPNDEYINTTKVELPQENTVDEGNKNNDKNNDNNKNNNTPYYIKVNYGAQVVTIYKKDGQGNYTIPVKAMVCSTGTHTPTSGVYKLTGYKRQWQGLQGDVYGQYSTQIIGNILFHSVPYLKNGDNSSLEYWEYDKLGTKASLGCIRLTVQDALWIYNNCSKGTSVEFYSSNNPSPLGKPSAKKISSYASYLRNWDPTDPNTNNPWKSYNEQKDKPNNNTNTQNNSINDNNVVVNEQVNEQANELVSNELINNTINNQVNEMVDNNMNEEVHNKELLNVESNILDKN